MPRRMAVTRSIRQHTSSPVDENVVSSDMRKGKRELCFDSMTHPLLIDVVLSTLFENIPGNDLQACRLVCKRWNLHSLPSFCSKFQATISGKTGVKNFVKLIESNTLGHGLPKFEKFILGPFDTTVGFGQKFLQLFGKTAKEFVFVSEDCGVYMNFHQFEHFSELLRSAPNLVSLTVPSYIISKSGCRLFSENVPKPKLNFLKYLKISCECPWNRLCPTLYEEIFKAAENISTVEFTNSLTKETETDLCANILRTVEKLGRESGIENLKLGHKLTPEQFQVIRRMGLKPKGGLKLKHLEFNYFDGEIFFDLIQPFRNTLISLDIKFHVNRGYFNEFSTMPKLKFLKLEILGGIITTTEGFHSTFPCLEKLELKFNKTSQLNEFIKEEVENAVRPNLKSSKIHCDFPIQMENLNRILKVFLNLTELECQIPSGNYGPIVIRKIWKHLTQLDRLKISGTLRVAQNLDSLVTGISEKQLKKINMKDFLDSLQGMTIEDRREKVLMEVNKYRKLSFIGNLTKLKFLELRLKGGYKNTRNYLTDSSGFFAFYSLRNLRQLCVKPCEISKHCAKMLVNDLGLNSWKFSPKKSERGIIPSNW